MGQEWIQSVESIVGLSDYLSIINTDLLKKGEKIALDSDKKVLKV